MTTTTEQSADGMLFTGEEQVNATRDEYAARLAAVRERYDAYHPDMHSRRYVADSYHDAARCIRQAAGWLAGDNDRTYAGPRSSRPRHPSPRSGGGASPCQGKGNSGLPVYLNDSG